MISASTSSRREMLQGMTWASPPAFLMPSATSWQASALRLEITTFAPSFASSSAEERPMPRLEPVMTATFPVRSNGVFFIVVVSLLPFIQSSSPGLSRAIQYSRDDCARVDRPRRTGSLRFRPGMTVELRLTPARPRR